jgi:preprotein translocase subunit SecB
MELQILKTKASKISFNQLQEEKEEQAKHFEISYKIIYDAKKDNIFAVVFNSKIIHPNDFELIIEHVTSFKTSESIDADFKKSDFPKINAPAIAFPFLRSLVATITTNSGYRPAFLPSINFMEASKTIYKD